MTDLIDLQHCHVTQITEKGNRGPWLVRQNITSKDLWELPAHLTEAQVFDILRFARHFELEALNAGIRFQKGKQNKAMQDTNKMLRLQLEQVTAHADMLADTVERLTHQEGK